MQIRGVSATDMATGSRHRYDPEQFDVIAIASNPDWEEDASGVPFSGQSGDKFKNILGAAGIDSDRVYVTYAVKCKPPQGRRPSAKEYEACREHLRDELASINPKFIVLMGSEALRLFRLGAMGGINAIHGKVFRRKLAGWEEDGDPAWNVMATFSPLQFSYRPSEALEARCVEDWKLISRKGTGAKNVHRAEYRVADTLAKVREMVDELKAVSWFAFDSESCALNTRRMPMLCASFSLGYGKNWILPIRRHVDSNPAAYEWNGRVLQNLLMEDRGFQFKDHWSKDELLQVSAMLREAMEDPSIGKAAHNIKYDLQVFRWWLGIQLKGFMFDTMCMKHLLDEVPPSDLETLADFEFGVGDYCLAPSTRVLTQDLQWITLQAVKVGDKLIGIEENTSNNQRRRIQPSTVETITHLTQPCYQITLEDGRQVISSAKHRWLARPLTGNNTWSWKTTESLANPWHKSYVGGYQIAHFCNTWNTETTFEAGWLAGFFDGEGYVSKYHVCAAQKSGQTLEQAKQFLTKLSFPFRDYPKGEGLRELAISSENERLRFLGSVRPNRLIKNYTECLFNRGFQRKGCKIQTIEYIGEQAVIGLQTSTRTFIAEGLVSHNSSEKRAITGQGEKLLNTYDRVPDEILWPYAATDAECCYRLCEIYYNRMQQKPHLWQLYCEEKEPSLWTLYRAEWHGSPIDFTVANSLEKEYKAKQVELEEKFARHVPRQFLLDKKNKLKEKHPNTDVEEVAFNPMSPNDVRDVLIKLGFKGEIEDMYATTSYNTSKDILLDLKDKQNCELAGWVLDYRTNKKMLSTYIDRVREDVDFDGRVRYSWFPNTASGRNTCRFLHQIPRSEKDRVKAGKPVLRDMFVVRPGYTYVYLDYSQIELRVIALLAREQTMLRFFEEGVDIHRETAARLLGCKPEEINDHNRQLGKIVNFGVGYGSKGYQIIRKGTWEDAKGNKRPVTREMFNAGMAGFKQLFPYLSDYLQVVPQYARMNGGTLRTVFGMERRLGTALNHGQQDKREAAEREAVNFMVQATANQVTVRTSIMIDNMLQTFIEQGQLVEDDVVMVNTVHDSLAYEVKDELVPWFTETLKAVAERKVPELTGFGLYADGYSFPCNIGVGSNWTQAELASK